MHSAINFDNCVDSGASVINWFVLFQDLSWSVFRAICDELEKDVIQLKLSEKIVRKVQFSTFSLNNDFRTGLGRKLWGQRRHWKGNRINPASYRLGDQFQIPGWSCWEENLLSKKVQETNFLSDYSLLTIRKNNAVTFFRTENEYFELEFPTLSIDSQIHSKINAGSRSRLIKSAIMGLFYYSNFCWENITFG